MKKITEEAIRRYETNLFICEKAPSTVSKYIKDVRNFYLVLGDKELEKRDVIFYKQSLEARYAPTSVNAALSSINGFFRFMGWHDVTVKSLKLQKQIFISEEKELSKTEYERLIRAAKDSKNERLYLLMQTICSTGIRVSELEYITVEALGGGIARINCKGKQRRVFLPRRLCDSLKKYAKSRKIKSGPVFVTKNGNPLDRSNIWSDMKRLCKSAGVSEKKVFPHNLRHLFARTYYSLQKDIVRLADVLGHSSVNTTRIYTAEGGAVHRRQIQKLGLLFLEPC
ncbi:MAG: tyrosine-type recombinase/integrase [Clostridia bacterium]|nr:tyrosine-type recombinase/integrase [Clostridia bacterium]